MPIVTGSIIEEWGPPKVALREVQQHIRAFCPPSSDSEYVVDLAFRTWHNFREPEEPYGVRPGPVGRAQKRFIIWHSVPKGLETSDQVRAWLVEVLPETERLIREHLPTKSRAYPAEQLGNEVRRLRLDLATASDAYP